MEYKVIGKSNLEASVIGFGAWKISGDLGEVDSKEMLSVMRKAYELGIKFFDTAPACGVESSGMKGWVIHK